MPVISTHALAVHTFQLKTALTPRHLHSTAAGAVNKQFVNKAPAEVPLSEEKAALFVGMSQALPKMAMRSSRPGMQVPTPLSSRRPSQQSVYAGGSGVLPAVLERESPCNNAHGSTSWLMATQSSAAQMGAQGQPMYMQHSETLDTYSGASNARWGNSGATISPGQTRPPSSALGGPRPWLAGGAGAGRRPESLSRSRSCLDPRDMIPEGAQRPSVASSAQTDGAQYHRWEGRMWVPVCMCFLAWSCPDSLHRSNTIIHEHRMHGDCCWNLLEVLVLTFVCLMPPAC